MAVCRWTHVDSSAYHISIWRKDPRADWTRSLTSTAPFEPSSRWSKTSSEVMVVSITVDNIGNDCEKLAPRVSTSRPCVPFPAAPFSAVFEPADSGEKCVTGETFGDNIWKQIWIACSRDWKVVDIAHQDMRDQAVRAASCYQTYNMFPLTMPIRQHRCCTPPKL
jgi:hypothetical protein